MQLSQTDEDRLAALLDDYEFQTIAESESRFNIFDALGTRRQELRHSDFLSYLLDPAKPHGLGSRFLRDFLLESTKNLNLPGFFNSIELRLLQLDDAQVSREKFNIDVLIESSSNWCVLIENKIAAKEHGDQLHRYKMIAEKEFDFTKTLLLFLTPDGDSPSDNDWISISHDLIANICKKWSLESSVPARTREALVDYYEFLEAYVIDDSKTAELCRKIYNRHKDALDLIFLHIPHGKDIALVAAGNALKLLESEGRVILDAKYSGLNRFWLPDIPNIPLAEGENWTDSQRGILFEWATSNKALRLDIVIGPMERSVRNSLMQLLAESDPDFYRHVNNNKFTHISKSTIFDIDSMEYQDGDNHLKEIEDDIYSNIIQLLESIVPKLHLCIEDITRTVET